MTFAGLVGVLIEFINSLVGLLAGVAMVVFFMGLVQYVYKSPNAKAKTYGRDLIVWGLGALFVLVSVWGILSVLRKSFFTTI